MSVQQIEDALQRQVLEGGEIDTALLELGAALENTLSSYRAASFGLPALSRETLMSVPAAQLALLPQVLARRYRVLPVAEEESCLVLAAGQPLGVAEARALEQATGRPLRFRIATDVRIDAALAKHYGLECAPRMRRLAEQLERWPAGELVFVEPMLPSTAPAPGSGLLGMLDDSDDAEPGPPTAKHAALALPPPTIVSERGVAAGASAAEPNVGVGRVVNLQPSAAAAPAQAAQAAPQAPSSASSAQRPAVSGARARPKRSNAVPMGPLTIGVGRELLDQAEDRDAVVEVFFSFARQYFDATALFAVREDRALGLESHNLPAVSDIREVSVLIEPASTLDELSHALSPRVVDLSRKRADHALALALDRLHEQPCALVPVCIRQRVVSLVYGDRRGESLYLADLSALVDLLPWVSQAFERIIRGRKAHAMQSRRPPPMAAAVAVAVAMPGRPAGAAASHSSTPAPRASWSSAPDAPAVTPQRASLPPVAVAGVFPSESPALRPHETPTPAERPGRVLRPAVNPTLSGIPQSGARPTSAEAAPASAAPAESAPAADPVPEVIQVMQVPDEAFSTRALAVREAKDALGLLGVPRSAPPPPAGMARPAADEPPAPTDAAAWPPSAASGSAAWPADIERSKTLRLPVQTPALGSPEVAAPPAAPAGSPELAARPPAARWSKPPPGAGVYRSVASERDASRAAEPASADELERDDDHDTSPRFRAVGPQAVPIEPALETRPIRRSRPALEPGAAVPDTSEPPPGPNHHPSRPPPRVARQVPGAGVYRAQDIDREVVSFAPPAPEPAGRSSRPPGNYRSDRAPADIVALPPPPRLPGAGPDAEPRRRRTGEITQPLGPRRPSQQAQPAPPRPAQPADEPAPAAERPVAGEPARARAGASDSARAPDARREGSEATAPSADVVQISEAVRQSIRPPVAVATVAEPSIIVDPSLQAQQLIVDLCRCGPDDEARSVQLLLRLGEAALPALIEHFPGPLWFDRRRPHPRLPLGRDVSAIARALAAFGERASPYLWPLLTAANADTRFYATLLASDHVYPALLPALAERLFDTDPQVRLIVRDTLPQYRKAPGFAAVIAKLRERAADSRALMQDRLAAIDALATLRDPESVPLFIAQNASDDKQLSVPAHRALVAITAQDFGNASRRWNAWYEDNRRLHRAQWLIESLMHPEQNVRATAGLELQKLTQVYYGFVAAAPKRDRERAQKRYRDWWELEGKKRFA